MLFLLDTEDNQAWRRIGADVERLGGRVLTVHPPQVMVVDVDPAVVPHWLDAGLVRSASTAFVKMPADLSVSAQAGVAFWNQRLVAAEVLKKDVLEEVAPRYHSDVFLPPDIPPTLLSLYEFLGFRTPEEEAQARAQIAQRGLSGVGSTTYYTSAFMSGEIVIGAILPESNGVIDPNVEGWTGSEVSSIQNRIITAMTRFQDDCPLANITLIFHWDDAPGTGGVAGTIDCDYEAINNESLARNDALSRLSYVGSPGARGYANHLRDLYDADWAFFFCVADNSVTGGGRAYAYIGGPLSQCYGHNSSSVFQHEVGHIFNAIDEYHPDASRSPIGRWGYQQVVNANSEYNNGMGFNGGAGEGLSALMNNTINKHSAYSTGQIGWYDSDGDGILDVSDSFPAVSLQLDSLANGLATFSGQATVSFVRSQQSGFGVGFSVNELTRAEWRLAGQAWQPATPVDGVLDTGVEDITFAVGPLPDGDYTVEARATHNLGNTTLLPAKLNFTVTGSTTTDASPFATFDADRLVQRVGFDVNFDATGCTDLEASLDGLEVRWDWNGDGSWDTAYDTDKITAYAFPSNGPHQVVVEVRDNSGQTSTATQSILITTGNVAPVASFQVVTPNIQGDFNPTYTFDATDSYDPEGGTVEVRWDWDANGTFDTGWSPVLTANHTYTLSTSGGGKSAQWTVVMQARDPDAATTEITREVWSCPYNNSPQISGFADPAVASTDTQVIFDMSATTDLNLGTTWDGLLEFRFDWDSDGNWDTDMLPDTVALHNFNTTGTYNVRVQTRDRFSALDEMTIVVEVGDDPVQQPFLVTGATIAPGWMRVAPNAGFQYNLSLDYIGTPGDLSATWFVDGIEGGDQAAGTITTNGLYTAPALTGPHQIKAESNDNPSVVAYASASVTTDFVQIYPDMVDIFEGQSTQFIVSTGFSVDPTVTWYLNDIPGGHPLLGSIDSNGLMAAPNSVFGEYPVIVKAVSNEDPSVSDTAWAMLRSGHVPTADFYASIVVGDAPLTVDFTAITSNGVTQWDWDFGDDTTGTGETVMHQYVDPGLYTVSLDVVAPGGAANETKVAYIQVNGGTAPLVDFVANVNPILIWGTASFTPTTIGTIDTYDWDFAGITTDIQTNGTWVQPPEGLHTISLTVTGPGGSATKTKVDYLDVRSSFYWVDFMAYGATSGVAPLSVEFVALPEAEVCEYDWDFGDPADTNGLGTNGPNPVHVYTIPGTYTVTLEVQFGGGNPGQGECGGGGPIGGQGTASVTKIDLIEVLAAPGDCSQDGVVDLNDYACFHDCLIGPGGGVLPGCELADIDGDGDVDLADFKDFQVLSGAT